MKKILSLVCGFLIHSLSSAQNNPPKLLLRLDDNGMNHSVTMAIQQVAESGIPFSTSVMFACPCYQKRGSCKRGRVGEDEKPGEMM